MPKMEVVLKLREQELQLSEVEEETVDAQGDAGSDEGGQDEGSDDESADETRSFVVPLRLTVQNVGHGWIERYAVGYLVPTAAKPEVPAALRDKVELGERQGLRHFQFASGEDLPAMLPFRDAVVPADDQIRVPLTQERRNGRLLVAVYVTDGETMKWHQLTVTFTLDRSWVVKARYSLVEVKDRGAKCKVNYETRQYNAYF